MDRLCIWGTLGYGSCVWQHLMWPGRPSGKPGPMVTYLDIRQYPELNRKSSPVAWLWSLWECAGCLVRASLLLPFFPMPTGAETHIPGRSLVDRWSIAGRCFFLCHTVVGVCGWQPMAHTWSLLVISLPQACVWLEIWEGLVGSSPLLLWSLEYP